MDKDIIFYCPSCKKHVPHPEVQLDGYMACSSCGDLIVLKSLKPPKRLAS